MSRMTPERRATPGAPSGASGGEGAVKRDRSTQIEARKPGRTVRRMGSSSTYDDGVRDSSGTR